MTIQSKTYENIRRIEILVAFRREAIAALIVGVYSAVEICEVKFQTLRRSRLFVAILVLMTSRFSWKTARLFVLMLRQQRATLLPEAVFNFVP